MATAVTIPKLGTAMTEGVLAEWLVADGDRVESGTPLYRLETDKVENEIEAPVSGVVTLLGTEDQTYPVGTKIAEIV